jgi:hypothetical protein
MVVRSLKEFVTFPRIGVLTLKVTLESRDDDIYVSTSLLRTQGVAGKVVSTPSTGASPLRMIFSCSCRRGR